MTFERTSARPARTSGSRMRARRTVSPSPSRALSARSCARPRRSTSPTRLSCSSSSAGPREASSLRCWRPATASHLMESWSASSTLPPLR
eukprot:12529271-Alexandrium_andersonii.AAC.1